MSTLNGPGEGTWSVFAEKVVEERDRLRGVCDLRLHIMERLEKERDEARAEVQEYRDQLRKLPDANRVASQDAFRRGAEAMRLACQQWCRAWENDGEAIADALADLRVEDKP